MYDHSDRDEARIAWLRRVRILVLALAALMSASSATADTFLVNSTGDSSDGSLGDGFCWTGGLVSRPGGLVAECTLRAAIEQANSTVGLDLVQFAGDLPVDGAGTSVIAIGSPLPGITARIRIDGRTAPGYVAGAPFAKPVVVLNGDTVAAIGTDGLAFLENADQSEVYALAIVRFSGDGIDLAGADSVLLDGLHIGVFRGLFAFGNDGHGIHVRSNSLTTRIGTEFNPFGGYNGIGNLVSANGGDGIRVFGDGTRISGNRIGVDQTGTAVFVSGGGNHGNGGFGVQLASGADNVSIGQVGSAIGGRVTSGNVISGNVLGGIQIGATLGVTIHGNFIGVDAAGTYALGNGASQGILLLGGEVVIGEEGVGRNVISGHQTHGIVLGALGVAASDDNEILGNRIGLNAAGDGVVPNQDRGIYVQAGNDNFIRGNWIGGNLGDGITLKELCTGNDVLANYVGTNPTGDDLGNDGNGIVVLGDVNTLGGIGSGNVTGFNFHGITLATTAERNSVQGNFVGTDAGGRDLANRSTGLPVFGVDNFIGGDFPGTENTIGLNGGNGISIDFVASGNRVVGNYIGTNASGSDLGNQFAGVAINGSATGNTIGGDADTPNILLGSVANVIAHNASVGVFVTSAAARDNSIRGNEIRDNEFEGVRLGASGGAANDFGDADTGANQLQNYPEFDLSETLLNEVTGNLDVLYRVTSDATNTAYPLKIDFYLTDADLEEPELYLGSDTYSAIEAFTYRAASINPSVDLLPTDHIVAMVTDANGNTSQASPAVPVPEPTVPLALAAGCTLLVCTGTRRVAWQGRDRFRPRCPR